MTGSVFLFCRINTKKLIEVVEVNAHVAAAYNKCISMANAFGSKDSPCTLVTAPVLNGGFGKLNKIRWLRYVEGRVNIVQLGCVGIPVLDRFFSAFGFLLFFIKLIRRNDVIVFYNFFPEYIPTAFLAKIAGVRIILDIEDAPREDERGMRGSVNRASFRILNSIPPNGYLTVSKKIVEKLNLDPVVVVYGVGATNHNINKFGAKEYSVINILFGGALMPETGVDLFLEMIDSVAENSSNIDTPLHFYITGFGDTEKILNKIKNIKFSNKISCTIAFDIAYDEYKKILQVCDVGLCLKDPHMEIGMTTFPSKVVEIASNGLLLISSKVSDVPLIFRTGEALILEKYDVISLLEILVNISTNTEIIQNIAIKGQNRVMTDFSEDAVKSNFYNMLDIL